MRLIEEYTFLPRISQIYKMAFEGLEGSEINEFPIRINAAQWSWNIKGSMAAPFLPAPLDGQVSMTGFGM